MAINMNGTRFNQGIALRDAPAPILAMGLLVANLTAIGESTGKLDQLLSKVADFYTRQIDDKVSNLVELIQPAMMVVIGLFVGVLFASILMPIYNLAQAF